MPHVDTKLEKVKRGTHADARRRVDPAWIAWLFVALMALLPLRAAFGAG